jgi:organic radical activating enzyme
MSIIDRIRERFVPVKPLPEGVHHIQAAPVDARPYRLHLRLHKDGSGVLIVNAATVLHLNPTATEYAYHFIKGTPDEEAARAIASRYRVSRRQALQDFQNFTDRIQTLVYTPDLDPVTYLDFERVTPHAQELTAPLRLDCALTYRLAVGSSSQLVPEKRVTRELDTAEWQTILDKAWSFGIPHVTFTGGEPTLRDDLPDLIAHGEKNGQVTGLLTDGLRLADESYLDKLLQTGLDHLLFILQPEMDASWKALEVIMPKDIFTAVHLTVTEKNASQVNDILNRLAGLDVTAISLSGARKWKDTLQAARDRAAELNLSLVFDLPVPYSASHPVSIETEEDNVPSGAGKTWLYVEPDGDVLPAQGIADQILGNLLKDPFQKIYK